MIPTSQLRNWRLRGQGTCPRSHRLTLLDLTNHAPVAAQSRASGAGIRGCVGAMGTRLEIGVAGANSGHLAHSQRGAAAVLLVISVLST